MEPNPHAPPPPPLPPGAQQVPGSARSMQNQLPPHLQAMMHQHMSDLRNELPTQFGAQPKSHHRKNTGTQGGRGGFATTNSNNNYNQHAGRGRGGGGNARGRGRGRGGYGNGRGGGRGGNSHYGNNNQHQNQHRQQQWSGGNSAQFKRKREPSDDVKDPSRFFLPSCLEDPWKNLETQLADLHVAGGSSFAGGVTQDQQQQQYQRQQHNAHKYVERAGRVLFQPSFLVDPWQMLVR